MKCLSRELSFGRPRARDPAERSAPIEAFHCTMIACRNETVSDEHMAAIEATFELVDPRRPLVAPNQSRRPATRIQVTQSMDWDPPRTWNQRTQTADVRFHRGTQTTMRGAPENPIVISSGVPTQEVKPEFKCPITRDIMKDPVVLGDGHTYERTAIQRWLTQRKMECVCRWVASTIQDGVSMYSDAIWEDEDEDFDLSNYSWHVNVECACGKITSPMTRQVLKSTELFPNRALNSVIEEYLDEEAKK